MFDAIKTKINKAKENRERAKKGYCSSDIWDMDVWFFLLIPKMLREYKEKQEKWGFIPTLFCDEWYEKNKERCEALGVKVEDLSDPEDESLQGLSKEMWKYNSERWDEELDRMIFLFEETDDNKCSKTNPYEDEYMEKCFTPWHDRFNKFVKTNKEGKTFPNDESEEAKRIIRLYQDEFAKIEDYKEECRHDAMNMFAKYIYDLWL